MTRTPSHATHTSRAHLNAHLDATDATLRHAHAQLVQQVQPALTTLLRDIQHARDRGEAVNIAWLYQQQRMARLTASVQHHAQQFETIAQVVIAQAQQHSGTLGEQAATAQLAERKSK
jgi:hypothetical protein